MIIRLESSSIADVEKAWHEFEALAAKWNHPLDTPEALPPAPATTRPDHKTIDPIAVTALLLAIPSAALAVLDLADRIQKRRRATELITKAHRLATRHVTVSLLTRSQPVELAGLTPDQLLDLLAEQDPAS